MSYTPRMESKSDTCSNVNLRVTRQTLGKQRSFGFSTILQSKMALTMEPTQGKTEVQKPAISHDKDRGKVFKQASLISHA